MKKVFITGGNGFIGRYITSDLLKQNYKVYIYDLLPHKIKQKGVSYVVGTILDRENMVKIAKGCDLIIHLAAVVGVKRTSSDPLDCLNINIQGTIKVLEAAVLAKVKKIVLISSSEVFGDLESSDFKENSPFNPKSGYAISKLACESYAYAFYKTFGLNYNIIRYFNIYGVGQKTEFVIPRFIYQASQKKPITVYGDGKQIRSFCHVSDASRATVQISLDSSNNNTSFNIGNNKEPVKMLDLAKLVIEKFNLDSSFIKHLNFTKTDRSSEREIYKRIPNISKIKRLYNFQPKTDLSSGIDEVIKNME